MDLINELSGLFRQWGIDPMIGGFILGIVSGLLLRSGKKAEPIDVHAAVAHAPTLSVSRENRLDSRLSIKIKHNAEERELTQAESQTLVTHINAGNKIEAIKYLREISGMGLKEAKDLVDVLEKSGF